MCATIQTRRDAGWRMVMGYDWNGARGRRMKIARFGTAVALAALLFSVVAQVVGRTI